MWTFFALPLLTGLTMAPFFAALIGLTVHPRPPEQVFDAPAITRTRDFLSHLGWTG